MRWRLGIVGAAAGALLLYAGAGCAQGGVQIEPISVTLPPGEQVAAFTLTNRGDSPQVFQAQPMRWQQADGQDKLTPAPKLIASPALFRLEAGASQVVRVGFAVPQPSTPVERAYRVLFSELPQDQSAHSGAGVHILLRMNVPLFYASSAPAAAARLHWTLQESPRGWTLRATNEGDSHARITALGLTRNGRSLVQKKGLWYVLAGAQQSWTFSHLPSAAPTVVTIHAETDHGTITDKIVPSRG